MVGVNCLSIASLLCALKCSFLTFSMLQNAHTSKQARKQTHKLECETFLCFWRPFLSFSKLKETHKHYGEVFVVGRCGEVCGGYLWWVCVVRYVWWVFVVKYVW